jgi:hypothetical protein
MALKNPRHEMFVREYIKSGIKAEAYRRVYPHVKPKTTARTAAFRLMTRDDVSRRYWQLQEQNMKRADITIEKVLQDYQYALDLAKEKASPGEITTAATAQAKLVGLLIDRRESGNAGDFDNVSDVDTLLAKVTAEVGPEAADALAKAFGIATEPKELTPPIDLQSISPPSDTRN